MRLLAFVICMLAPVQAMALSCMRPSLEGSYADAAAATESYLVVKGTITFDETQLPKPDMDTQTAPERTVIPARLNGHALTTAGFATRFDAPVDYVVRCAVIWCGGGQSGEQIIAFIEKTPHGYVLEMGPCGGKVFPATRENANAALECIRTGDCVR